MSQSAVALSLSLSISLSRSRSLSCMHFMCAFGCKNRLSICAATISGCSMKRDKREEKIREKNRGIAEENLSMGSDSGTDAISSCHVAAKGLSFQTNRKRNKEAGKERDDIHRKRQRESGSWG